MKTIVLDGNLIFDKESLYDVLTIIFELPNNFGRNMDALWECMVEDLNTPIKLKWINLDKCKNALGEEFYNKLLMFFREVEKEIGKDQFELII